MQYTKEEWKSGIIDVSKSNIRKTVFNGLGEITRELIANYPKHTGTAPLHIINAAKKNGIYEDDKIVILATNDGHDIRSWEFEIEWKKV